MNPWMKGFQLKAGKNENMFSILKISKRLLIMPFSKDHNVGNQKRDKGVMSN